MCRCGRQASGGADEVGMDCTWIVAGICSEGWGLAMQKEFSTGLIAVQSVGKPERPPYLSAIRTLQNAPGKLSDCTAVNVD